MWRSVPGIFLHQANTIGTKLLQHLRIHDMNHEEPILICFMTGILMAVLKPIELVRMSYPTQPQGFDHGLSGTYWTFFFFGIFLGVWPWFWVGFLWRNKKNSPTQKIHYITSARKSFFVHPTRNHSKSGHQNRSGKGFCQYYTSLL